MANTNTIAEEVVNNSEEVVEETAKQAATFAERHPNLNLVKVGGLLGLGVTAGMGLIYGAAALGKTVANKVRDRWNQRREAKAKAEVLEETKDE